MSKLAILCVDDEKMVLDNLKIQLKGAFGDSYRYEFAQDAEDALDLIDELQEEAINIILIVSDWLMPGMKGDEFLIRVHDRFPQVVTVLLTGQANDEAIAKAQTDANLHRCLFKPWTESELIETIHSGLAKL
jgi:CheY-like chemotaxis protein